MIDMDTARRLNYIAYYMDTDGYGRFNSRLVKALQKTGMKVKAGTMTHVQMPQWMLEQEGVDWKHLTVSSLPPYLLQSVPGPHWLLTMVEGSEAPEEWITKINNSNVSRVLVPCQHNKDVFERGGVLAPISILPGGTDPVEFPYLGHREWFYDDKGRKDKQRYTFLCFCDRGARKGWHEVWDAFYLAFGGKTTGDMDVRLIIKGRPGSGGRGGTKHMAKAEGADSRILYLNEDIEDMKTLYEMADCVVIPSRSEGWGMIHREAASMGIPVITQRFSGMDDGNTDKWAIVVEGGKMKPIPEENKIELGEWLVADKQAVADAMRQCYDRPQEAQARAQMASNWIRRYQSWDHSASLFLDLYFGEFVTPRVRAKGEIQHAISMER